MEGEFIAQMGWIATAPDHELAQRFQSIPLCDEYDGEVTEQLLHLLQSIVKRAINTSRIRFGRWVCRSGIGGFRGRSFRYEPIGYDLHQERTELLWRS